MPELTPAVPEVEYRVMHTLDQAIDLFCSRGLAEKTRQDYRRLLHRFANTLPTHTYVQKIEEDDILRYLGTRRHLSKGTQAWEETVFSSFFDWLYKSRKIKTNPMAFVPRTRRPDPESLDLKTVSSREVGLMLKATETWSERLCVAILAYLGPRRRALALLRVKDYDRERRRLRFHEKGGKTIWKPVPVELAELLDARLSSGAAGNGVARAMGGVGYPASGRDGPAAPDDYLIPPEGPLARDGDRDDRCIWRIVKKVAERAGVDAHTHSLRAAFADFCLDNGMDGKALQLLMGHKNPMTTERYTRRYDQQRRMESVSSLSWAAVVADNKQVFGLAQPSDSMLESLPSMGAGGFEPPEDEPIGRERAGSLRRPVEDPKPLKTRGLA